MRHFFTLRNLQLLNRIKAARKNHDNCPTYHLVYILFSEFRVNSKFFVYLPCEREQKKEQQPDNKG